MKKYLATGNSFNSLHYEYLLGTTTIREIVRTTCETTWICLKPIFKAEKTEDDWLSIANELNERSNFPHCIGAVDGKHIRMCKPDATEVNLHFLITNHFSLWSLWL
ncbi:hypothetical protein NQ314_016783 [Rhamnusium bicolor]|uniref:DDE Tnp4 domain-containing protein n=1 Tax=Rhamnusium bicolor TaxID=1586634 RepID=A0AAV8WV46_9CUCU|nr:hypothetical protein NQ314_016783 [Rhamnusium bicolor]